MPRRKEIIQVPPENVELLANEMKCGKGTVWNALAFRSDSAKCKQIRRLALSTYGGKKTGKYVFND